MEWIHIPSLFSFSLFFSFLPLKLSTTDNEYEFDLPSGYDNKLTLLEDYYDKDFKLSWVPLDVEAKPSCTDENRQFKMCTPEFSNAAADRAVEVTNTCGMGRPQEFCRQMGIPWARAPCEICDASIPHRAHLPHHMTDFNTEANLTWWMSETMEDGINYPGQVNLTLDFGKSFDISYIRIRFYSSRPESFAIYKRTSSDSSWTPYQYYSATCNETYNLPDGGYFTRENETQPLCTSEFSDISPLTGGTVLFSTLEGRPG
ncbi:Laminin subunit gamma-1, partial [Stegodyphus mimosarum]